MNTEATQNTAMQQLESYSSIGRKTNSEVSACGGSSNSSSTDLALDQENGGNADAHEDDDRHDHGDL